MENSPQKLKWSQIKNERKCKFTISTTDRSSHFHFRSGDFEVVLLDDDINTRISSLYQVSKDVAKFEQAKFEKVSRGAFGKQARLRRPVPSKQFAVASKS